MLPDHLYPLGRKRRGDCFMEAVARFKGEEIRDDPECASPMVARFMRTLNDAVDHKTRDQLISLIPSAAQTASDGRDEVRIWVARDWIIRWFLSELLNAAGRFNDAVELRIVQDQITSDAVLIEALERVRSISTDLGAGPHPGHSPDPLLVGHTLAQSGWTAAFNVAFDDPSPGVNLIRYAVWEACSDAIRNKAKLNLSPLELASAITSGEHPFAWRGSFGTHSEEVPTPPTKSQEPQLEPRG